MQKITTALLVVALAGCVSQQSAYGPPPPGIEWARKDGQRMSGNPALLEKGIRDKASCSELASRGDAVDFDTFSACMDRNGYYRRDLAPQ
jgi:hypothetical protein